MFLQYLVVGGTVVGGSIGSLGRIGSLSSIFSLGSIFSRHTQQTRDAQTYGKQRTLVGVGGGGRCTKERTQQHTNAGPVSLLNDGRVGRGHRQQHGEMNVVGQRGSQLKKLGVCFFVLVQQLQHHTKQLPSTFRHTCRRRRQQMPHTNTGPSRQKRSRTGPSRA